MQKNKIKAKMGQNEWQTEIKHVNSLSQLCNLKCSNSGNRITVWVCSKIRTNKNFPCHRQVLSPINHEKKGDDDVLKK